MKNFSKQSVVKHPETDAIITTFIKKDKDGIERTYGTVRVDEVVLVIANGFTSKQSRTAFITLDEDSLEVLTPHIKEGAPYPMDGKIVVLETLEPQWVGHAPKINPSTGENILVDGELVYRSSDFTSDLKALDVLLKSTGTVEEASSELSDEDIA